MEPRGQTLDKRPMRPQGNAPAHRSVLFLPVLRLTSALTQYFSWGAERASSSDRFLTGLVDSAQRRTPKKTKQVHTIPPTPPHPKPPNPAVA
jgi:hypothetical protein